MEEVQVGNADINSAPESFISDDASEDFFGRLEQEVNGVIVDDIETKTSTVESTQSDNMQEVEAETSEANTEDIETLKKRYSDSSAEGKRLNQRLSELEPYLPILDEMRTDQNLVSHVKGYFDGGGQAPQSMVEKMNLGEDFVFDPDDAVGIPDSDSAKVLNATIDGVVQRKLNSQLEKQKQEFTLERQLADFKTKHEMNDSQYDEFKKFADTKTLSLDDIFYLKNRGQRETNIAKSASDGAVQQVRQTQQRPKSLATQGSAKVETSEEGQIFDAIMGIDKDLENAFG
jgi:ATP-dependent Lon protease|tara:strand:+ start:3089 stop:3952 length:864 start_codon:yes stop_codon:yes gene_type:complete